MALSKTSLLEKAVEIAKAYGEGGGSGIYPDVVLRKAFEELKRINKELDTED